MLALGGAVNAITVIYPYKHNELWVFDDADVALEKEPFIAGADTMIDRALQAKGIEDGEGGFRLLFSATPFPGSDFKFDWLREGDGGNYYHSKEFEMEGWLCPALLRYFNSPPTEIYVKFEAQSK